MKKILAFAIFSLLISLSGSTQSISGIKGGINVSTIDYNQSYYQNIKPKLDYQIGFYNQKSIADNIFIRPELFYIKKGAAVKIRNRNFRMTYYMISLPLLIGINHAEFVYFIGPEISYVSHVYGRTSGFNLNQKNILNYSAFDFGLTGGANYKVSDKIILDLRYTHGLLNMLPEIYSGDGEIESKADGQNRSVQVGINYVLKQKI